MVIRHALALVFLVVTAASCTQRDGQVAEDVADGAPAVSGADSAALESAPVRSVAEVGIGSIALNVQPEDRFTYRVEQLNVSNQDSVTVRTTGLYDYDLVVKSVRSDRSVEFGMTFTAIKMNMEARRVPSGEKVADNTFDSRDSAQRADKRNTQFTALLDEQATVLLSSTGELKEVSGLTPIINKLLAAAPPQQRSNPDMQNQVKAQLEQAMYASFLGQQMVPYPDTAIGSDATWTKKQTSPVFGGAFIVNSSTEYTITGIRTVRDHQIADIDAVYAGTIKLGPPPKQATTKLTLNKSKISGTSKARLDLTTGMTVSKENRILMDVMATAVDPQRGGTQSMSQKQETMFKITLLR